MDRLYLPALVLIAAAAIVLASMWPQGYGDRSPAPFGFTPIQRTPEMQEKMRREALAQQQRTNRQRAAASAMQAQSFGPSQ